jgi:hypothetical protein
MRHGLAIFPPLLAAFGAAALGAGALPQCSQNRSSTRPRAELHFLVARPRSNLGYSGEKVLALLGRADASFREACPERPFPKVSFALASSAEPVRRDARSVIRFQIGRFCPDDARDAVDCYEARRAAITHIYPPLDGTPLNFVSHPPEVDIDINALHFKWSELGEEALLTVLRHELGHAFGLVHSCEPPHCDEVARSSVMYPYPLEVGLAFPAAPTQRDCAALPRSSWGF